MFIKIKSIKVVLILVSHCVILAQFSFAELNPLNDRGVLLKGCQECHPKVYKNWQEGPHGNAYHRLLKYAERINNATDKEEIPPHIFEDVKDLNDCYSCHAPQNIFKENTPSFLTDEFASKVLNATNEDLFSERPEKRSDHLESGVDCLTCHLHNNQVLTKSSYTPTKDFSDLSGFCQPQASTIFDHGYSCFSCHVEEVSHLAKKRQVKDDPKYLDCATCHSRPGEDGSWDHYYNWAGDQEFNRTPQFLIDTFDNIDAKIIQKEGKPYLELAWKNEAMSHKILMCTEFVLDIHVHDLGGVSLWKKTLRSNRKEEFEAFIGPETNFSSGDFSMDPDAEGFHKEFPLPSSMPAHGKINVNVRKKQQYFIPDHYFEFTHDKEISF